MEVALLGPGPSLVDYCELNYDAVIGVNRAACKVECDYLVAMDHPFLKANPPRGNPTLITSANTRDSLTRRGIEYDTILFDDYLPGDVKNPGFSMLNACLFAVYALKAKQVNLWGVDHKGDADWDGYKWKTVVRNPKRWMAEAEAIKLIFESHGVGLKYYGYSEYM